MKLSEIQKNFQDHMLRDTGEIDTAFSTLYQSGNIPFDERLRVYRDNIIGGLAKTLADTFPAVTALTGEEFALSIMRNYIRKHPPQSGCIQDYGCNIPDFIKTIKTAESVPYLSDVAQFDWAMSACEHTADDTALRPEDLATLMETEEPTLHPRTSTYLISSPYALSDIRAFALNANNQELEPPPLKKETPCYLLVYRPHLKAEYLELSQEEYDLFEKLQKNKPLNEALENTLKKHQAFDFQTFLQKFIARETFRK